MSHIVYCRKYRQELEGLDKPPFPGPGGKAIYETVSHRAWQAWLHHQTLLINERHLNVMDPQSREFLAQQRERFLDNEEVARADGYVPPTTDEPE